MVLHSTDLFLIILSSLTMSPLFSYPVLPLSPKIPHRSLPPPSRSPALFDYITRFVFHHNPSYILSVFLKPTQPGQALIMPSACYCGQEEEDGVKLKCRGGGNGGGKRHIYTNTQFPKHSWGLVRAKKSLFPGTPNPWVEAKDHNLCAQLTLATRDTLGFFRRVLFSFSSPQPEHEVWEKDLTAQRK